EGIPVHVLDDRAVLPRLDERNLVVIGQRRDEHAVQPIQDLPALRSRERRPNDRGRLVVHPAGPPRRRRYRLPGSCRQSTVEPMRAEDRASTTLRPLQPPRSLAEDAADMLREQILGGGYRQGEHLVEARIAEQLNVSRGPVREAFKLLRAEGLLEEEPRRGTFVVSLTADDVREIYGLRAAIEGRAARLLAEMRRPS